MIVVAGLSQKCQAGGNQVEKPNLWAIHVEFLEVVLVLLSAAKSHVRQNFV